MAPERSLSPSDKSFSVLFLSKEAVIYFNMFLKYLIKSNRHYFFKQQVFRCFLGNHSESNVYELMLPPILWMVWQFRPLVSTAHHYLIGMTKSDWLPMQQRHRLQFHQLQEPKLIVKS
jgi:hypothetical protein